MDAVRGPLKAGAAALFAVGLLLLFLNPPSLSGAEGMAVLVGGGLMLMLATAWASVALTGSDSMPEHEFERLVRRSEELAATPSLRAETGPPITAMSARTGTAASIRSTLGMPAASTSSGLPRSRTPGWR